MCLLNVLLKDKSAKIKLLAKDRPKEFLKLESLELRKLTEFALFSIQHYFYYYTHTTVTNHSSKKFYPSHSTPSRAQFRENRTIFNTPNPRLMNVSLMKDSKLFGGKGENSKNGGKKRSKARRESLAKAAAAAAFRSLSDPNGGSGEADFRRTSGDLELEAAVGRGMAGVDGLEMMTVREEVEELLDEDQILLDAGTFLTVLCSVLDAVTSALNTQQNFHYLHYHHHILHSPHLCTLLAQPDNNNNNGMTHNN